MSLDQLRTDAGAILRAGVEAVDPFPLTTAAIAAGLPVSTPSSSMRLIAAGKAAWPMAEAACAALGTRVSGGVVAGPRVRGGELPASIDCVEGGHPLPDARSLRAASRAMELAREAAAARDPVLLLLSGGASAMLAAPSPGISLDDKRRATASLLHAGADIVQLNCVRKHLSAVKGGRLGATAGECVTLAISDVHAPPDDPAVIGSGPATVDPTTFEDALRVIDSLDCAVPDAVRAHLRLGVDGRAPETPKPGDPRLAHCTWQVIGNRHTAMNGAAREARRRGYAVRLVGTATRGEARVAGRLFAQRALAPDSQLETPDSKLQAADSKLHAAPPRKGPVCVIASGETTVTVRGAGKGGRNQEFALGAASALAAARELTLLASVGTDGVDGPTDAAGAVVSSHTMADAAALGFDVDDALARNDAYPLLDHLHQLLVWGPTLTNVGDLHILLTIYP